MLEKIKKFFAKSFSRPASRDVALSFPAKLLGGSVPLISVGIVVFQIYSSADEGSILASSGVRPLTAQTWAVKIFPEKLVNSRECLESRCYDALTPIQANSDLLLPKDDPLAAKAWVLPPDSVVIYETTLPAKLLQGLSEPVLYLPGVRASIVKIAVNNIEQNESTGNLPFFVKLPQEKGVTARLAILLKPSLQSSFQGFIRSTLFLGEVQTVYRAHYRLSFRSFPRQAVILFLLSTGALTFAFFIFLDRKRELFALGVAISVLGVAEAVKVGLIPFLGTKTLFTFSSLHMVFLSWYGLELARVNTNALSLLAGWALFMGSYLIGFTLPEEMGKEFRFWTLQALNTLPILTAFTDFRQLAKSLKTNREFALQTGLGAGALLIYGLYLFASDFESSLPFKASSLYGIPVLLCVSVWITSALANLGSLEDRVEAAVVDREKRIQMEQDLILAEAVQKSFINPGHQESTAYEVHTLYKAARSVGGDWLAWKDLPGDFHLAIVADVVGKGIQAGLIVSACDAALNLMMGEIDPATNGAEKTIRHIVSALHRAVLSFHTNRAMTALIMLGTKQGNFTFTSLGHPPLVILGGAKSRIVTTPNNWLTKNFDQTALNIKTVDLHPGETAVAYTDGVCDGSRQLKIVERQWKEWAHLPIEEMITKIGAVDLNPDRDDQSVMLVRMKAETVAVPESEAS